jgi:hypothetical protein
VRAKASTRELEGKGNSVKSRARSKAGELEGEGDGLGPGRRRKESLAATPSEDFTTTHSMRSHANGLPCIITYEETYTSLKGEVTQSPCPPFKKCLVCSVVWEHAEQAPIRELLTYPTK